MGTLDLTTSQAPGARRALTPGTGYVTAADGAQIFYKDWGAGQPIVFSHGWPLSADDWEAQMMFFGNQGYRVIAHDRRGHGRSSQTWDGNEMDTYADDLAALVEALDLKDVIHVGHSTGGGEVAHFLGRHGTRRASRAVLISAVPPGMLKDRAQLYLDIASGPFYGFNRPDAKVSQGLIDRWYLQGMLGSPKGHYDCIKAFSETDFTEDLKKIDIPVFIMHGDDDQVVPIKDSALKGIKLLKKGTLKVYPGYPHGMPSTHAEVINADLLAWLRGDGPSGTTH
jgi:non-heme chloroperoxidase